MYWYNPKTRKMEEISTPKTDAGAIEMLDGVRVSVEFIAEFGVCARCTGISRSL